MISYCKYHILPCLAHTVAVFYIEVLSTEKISSPRFVFLEISAVNCIV